MSLGLKGLILTEKQSIEVVYTVASGTCTLATISHSSLYLQKDVINLVRKKLFYARPNFYFKAILRLR